MPSNNNNNKNIDVIIIGAGLAGLSAAIYLQHFGLTVKILEASERVGGRVKTDLVNGYLLDRGFQVLFTEYPETKQILNFKELDLRSFQSGVQVFTEDENIEVHDPRRFPDSLFHTLFANIGNFKDKWKILSISKNWQRKSIQAIFEEDETTTFKKLIEIGFTKDMINQFFRPFLGGIFLEKELNTSSRMFGFVWKMMASGKAAIPAQGMEMIPKQMAGKLLPETLLVNKKVSGIESNRVTTSDHEIFHAKNILIATEFNELTQPYFKNKGSNTSNVTCIYFCAPHTPIHKPLLGINGNNDELWNNISIMNLVSGEYGPEGQYLIAITIIQDTGHLESAQLINQVKKEWEKWIGKDVEDWKHLKTYHIPQPLPVQTIVKNHLKPEDIKLREGLYIAGDHLLNGSINAAIKSGRLAAEQIYESYL